MRLHRFIKRFLPAARQLLHQSQCRCLSSAPQPEETGVGSAQKPQTTKAGFSDRFKKALQDQDGIRRVLFRTTETNPMKHANQHIGLYYKISDEDFRRFMAQGLNQHFYKMNKSFSESCLMVRAPATEIIKGIQAANYDMPVVRYLLYGRGGSGKSSSLAHVVHACGVQNWLVLQVPWAVHYNRYSRELQQSTHNPGLMDTPLEAAAWLSSFQHMNAPLLKEIQFTASQKYVWSKREITEPGTPLTETIEFALGRAKYATDIMGMVLKEIKLHAIAKKFRVLVAIDGVNALWRQTLYKQMDNRHQKYEADDLAIIHLWRKMIKNDWSGGAVVCTVDPYVNKKDDRSCYMPKYLLGEKGFELLDPMIPIHVPSYTEKEVHSTLEYLHDRKWIHNLTDGDREELLFLSDCNPFEVYRITRSW